MSEGYLNSVLAKLRGILDEPSPMQKSELPNQVRVQVPGAGAISIPRPPQFQPPPEAVGADASRAVQQLLTIAPSLQGFIRRVQVGPTEDVMKLINRNRNGTRQIFVEGKRPWDPSEFKSLNLMGLTNLRTGDISLNPRTRNEPLAEWNLPSVLTHEAAHAAGYGPEEVPEQARTLIGQAGGLDPLVQEVLKRRIR